MIELIHVTTDENGEKILKEGFNPKKSIQYKYYSKMGTNGIYFYESWDMRTIQFYAQFLRGKNPNTKEFYLIYAEVPKSILKTTEKHEDGIFISNKDISKIKIIKVKKVIRSKIYDLY